MRVSVLWLSGGSFRLDVEPSESVDSLKARIQERAGENRENLYLFVTGQDVLEEGHTLADYDIQDGSVLQLMVVPPFPVHFMFVREIGEDVEQLSTVSAFVHSYDTVGDVKAKIRAMQLRRCVSNREHARRGRRPNDPDGPFGLFLNGQAVENDKRLFELGIDADFVLQIDLLTIRDNFGDRGTVCFCVEVLGGERRPECFYPRGGSFEYIQGMTVDDIRGKIQRRIHREVHQILINGQHCENGTFEGLGGSVLLVKAGRALAGDELEFASDIEDDIEDDM